MFPQPARDLVAATFPATPITELAPTFGGFSHASAMFAIGDRQVVAKAATAAPKRDDLRREMRALELLRGSGLPTAPPLALAENDSWTVEVLEFVRGTPGLRLLGEAPDLLPQAYAELGRVLSLVHRVAPHVPPADLLLAERAAATVHALPSLALDADLKAALASSLAHSAWRASRPVLVHGDAGIHNILWDETITALLDWEWSGFGSQLVDITWMYWTIRWRSLPIAGWQGFRHAYARGGELFQLDATTLRALALGQIAHILVRVRHDTDAWNEWVRRARWTLALDFSDAMSTG